MYIDVSPIPEPHPWPGPAYAITVYPGEGETFPPMPFLHKGDWFEDADGAQFEIVQALMEENSNGSGRERTYAYFWRYIGVAGAAK